MINRSDDDGKVVNDNTLLSEFEYVSNSYWRNEELGDKRLNIYITVATAILVAAVAIIGADIKIDDINLTVILVIGLTSLLIFGVLTFIQMMHRNLVSDEYKRRMDKIRFLLASFNQNMGLYLNDLPFKKIMDRKRRWYGILTFGKGGLVETVQLFNSIIVYVIYIGLIYRMFYWDIRYAAFSGIGLLLVSWILHNILANNIIKKSPTNKSE